MIKHQTYGKEKRKIGKCELKRKTGEDKEKLERIRMKLFKRRGVGERLEECV
jgi:hypothetical protein